MPAHISPELVRAALSKIPPTLPRDEWAKIAMAIKSEFPDEVGFELFDQWSRGDQDGYRLGDCKATWRSVKPLGAVKIGTLLHMAQRYGFDVKGAAGHSADSMGARDARAAEAQAHAREQAERHERVAGQAEAMWRSASESGESEYLDRKGVQAYGVRFAGKTLLVPMCDIGGRIWNVQQISGAAKRGAPGKLFLKNGLKSGLLHWIGAVDVADTALVCEGYATGASLHEATGLPVAVAFDAGNLVHVCKAIRARWPTMRLLVCGDDDLQTYARSGRNPGREKAEAAARSAGDGAGVVFPGSLPAGGSDFNDMHQAVGLALVREAVERALPRVTVPGATTDAPTAERASVFERFSVNDEGVWHAGIDSDGKPKPPEWVCSRLDVQALTRDQDGGGWGYLLSFADPLGKLKQWAMPARMLAGDGGEYRAALLGMGLRIAPATRARNLLTQYIQTRQPEEFASCTDRIGWHGGAFVLPHESIGDHDERIVFQTENAVENTFRAKGTAQQWRDHVASLCAGNSRLVFAVSCAFAGPLLRPAGIESGGFHFRGDSSSGKTTALKVAASVWGGPSFLQRWRTTDNALEAIAAQHCDCTLILDELAQVDPKQAGECAYMLANEQAKARATRNGAPRPRLTWRLLFLSAGELGLADHMAEGMKRARTGQEVRMADVPADAGAGMGAFENLHGVDGGSLFARRIVNYATSLYGAAGREWLDWLCGRTSSLKSEVRELAARIAAQLVPTGAAGQVERVAARFALVGAAGELATSAGLTGWQPGEGERAARACFNAWLAARGGVGNGEVVAMLRQVRRFLEMNAEGRFSLWHRSADDHAPKTLQRAGVRRMLNGQGEPIKSNSQHAAEFGDRMPASLGEEVSYEYFILAETFKAEVCQGFDPQAVCAVLAQHGCLQVDEPGRYNVKARLPGIGHARCYRVRPAIFELDL